MRIKSIVLVLLLVTVVSKAQTLPERDSVLHVAQRVNSYFMATHPNVGEPITVNGKTRPSNIWTRAVYYEGLMELYGVYPDAEYYQYALDWAKAHEWDYRRGAVTRNADNYCAGQTYIDLYNLCPESYKLTVVRSNMNMLLNTPQVNDWTWIDAIQMGMPVLAKMGRLTGDARYWEKMWLMYSATRNDIGGGLYNSAEGLWWRDAGFVPPYKEPNGKNCYWSRGNGWVYAALVRIMNETPCDEAHREAYLSDFRAMSSALAKCQRADGFWNVSLHCVENYGGKESTGTSLFVYGMAWGINHGILPADKYMPVLLKAWNALVLEAVHPNGYLGYMQGTGKEPKDGQPVTYDSVPDFDDYGVGCFLMAAAEMYRLAK